jgi:hypothetical protein
MQTSRARILAALVVASAFPVVTSSLGAQIHSRPRVSLQVPSRFTIGGDLLVSVPKGELDNQIDNGFGGNLYGLFRIDREGAFSIRGDLGGLEYGNETVPVPGYPLTGRVGLRVVTSNDIFWGSIGPQFTLPLGPVRPYANVGLGFMYFSTNSSVRGEDQYGGGYSFGNTENQSDNTHTWIFGGGILFRLGTGPTAPLSLNVGGRYFTGGEATYLKEGAIRDNPDGTITIFPSHSKTDQITWQVGVSYTIPRYIHR